MPFTYSICPDRKLLRHTWSDKVTLIELRQLLLAVQSDPLYRPMLDVLADFRDAEIDIPHEEMLALARFAGDRGPTAKHAVVVKRQMEFGMARMYELMSGSAALGQLRIFKDIEDAEAWLDGRSR